MTLQYSETRAAFEISEHRITVDNCFSEPILCTEKKKKKKRVKNKAEKQST